MPLRFAPLTVPADALVMFRPVDFTTTDGETSDSSQVHGDIYSDFLTADVHTSDAIAALCPVDKAVGDDDVRWIGQVLQLAFDT